MKICVTGFVVLALMAACSSEDDRIAFDGKYFRVSVKKIDKQRDSFIVKVKGVSQSFNGARQAAEYEGTKYCVSFFGSSDIYWKVGPQTPATSLLIEKNTLTYEGRCAQARPAKTGG